MDNALFRLFRRLCVERHGAIVIEFALVLPVLVLLTMSGGETFRFILLNQKVERASATVADLTSQAQTLSEGDLNNLFLVTNQVMSPFNINDGGQVIVSSIGAKGGEPPQINWQRSFGQQTNSSVLGVEGGVAKLPAGFVVRDNENVIVAEVYYPYAPFIFSGVIAPMTLYDATFFRPRFGSLDKLD